MDRMVYADNAATTKISDTAFNAMIPYLKEEYGNPSSVYSVGRNARRAIESARYKVARLIGASPEEIYFTSGGTESDNWAIQSAVELGAGRHIITSAVEHAAVLDTLKYFEKKGCEVTYIGVDAKGQISPDELRGVIRDDTALITIMTANNEIGTILPVSEIGKIAREKNILFHTDAVQAVGHIPVNVGEMNVDFLSLSGHKFGGAKGVGALYVRKGIKLPQIMHGGGQERGKRAGTENIAGIVSLAAALEEMTGHLPLDKVSQMRNRLIEGVLKIPRVHLTGDPVNRLPGIASFVFECIEGEPLVFMLNKYGICASAGSACSSGSLNPSHVLTAVGLPDNLARGALRLSLSNDNTDGDIDYIVEKLTEIIDKLRNTSPLWEESKV